MLSELEHAQASGQALVLVIGASRDNPSDVERWDRICSETFGGVWFGLSGPYIFNSEYGPQFPVETMRPFYDTFGENWETWEFKKMKDAIVELGWPDIRFDHVISDDGVLQYWKKVKLPQRNKLCLYWGHPDTIYYVGPVGKPDAMMKMWKIQGNPRKTYESYTLGSVYHFSSLIKQTGTIEINLYRPDSDDISTYLVCELRDRIKQHKLFKGIGSSGFILRM